MQTADTTPLLPIEKMDPTEILERLVAHQYDDCRASHSHKGIGSHIADWGVRGVAVSVGALAAYYYVRGAKNAAEFLCNKLNITESLLGETLRLLLPGSTGALNTLLGAQCLIESADDIRRPNKFREQLKKDPTENNSSRYLYRGKIAFFTAASLAAPFVLAGPNMGAAIGNTVAAMFVNYVGIANAYKKEIPEYQSVLPTYINEILQNLRHRFQQDPDKVCELIDDFYASMDKAETISDKNSIMLQEIFKLTDKLMEHDSENPNEKEAIHLLKEPKASSLRKAFAISAKTIAISSSGGYAWVTAKDISDRMPNLPLQLFWGISAFIATLIPLWGLSSLSGEKVGNDLLSGQKELSDTIAPNITKGLNLILSFFALFSGGTNLFVNHAFVTQFPLISKLFTEAGQTTLSVSYMGDAVFGAAMTNGYYSSKLLDEIIVFLMEIFSKDQRTQKYIKFDNFLTKQVNNYLEMSTPNFDDILHTQLLPNGNKEHDETRNYLASLLQTRLGGPKYFSLLEKLELRNSGMPHNDIKQHDPSELIPSPKESSNPNLRHRKGFHLK